MKKAKVNQPMLAMEDMRPEYDFRGEQGVRGKYYRAYRQGHTVKIREADGTVTVQHFTLADGAVMLEPDVRAYFPNSKAVNKILRSIIALVPSRDKRRTNVSKGR
jgi:hypothetical protein